VANGSLAMVSPDGRPRNSPLTTRELALTCVGKLIGPTGAEQSSPADAIIRLASLVHDYELQLTFSLSYRAVRALGGPDAFRTNDLVFVFRDERTGAMGELKLRELRGGGADLILA
jgi:hypothetical protein